MFLYVTHAARALKNHYLSGEGINLWITYLLFWPLKDMGGPPRLRDQLNTGAISETVQTWKTVHTRYTLIYSNKANMKWWLWRSNDIGGHCGPKVSLHLSYRRGKIPKKPHSGNLSRPGIEPGTAAWQARMPPPFLLRWTIWKVQYNFYTSKKSLKWQKITE